MLDQTLAVFGIRADHDLKLMIKGQSLGTRTARAIEALDLYFGHDHQTAKRLVFRVANTD
jgi:UDP-N-acetylglucosamine 2-epimerase